MIRTLTLLAALLLALSPGRSQAQTYDRYSMSFFGAFDTVITIMGYATSPEVFEREAALAQQRFDELNKLFDKYNDYPGVVNVRTLNREAGKGPVKVEQELFDLIQYAKDMAPATHDTVNIALGTVLVLWHDARELAEANPESAAPPDMERLMEANQHTRLEDVLLDEEALTIVFRDPKLLLDVGAVAKGYAVELVAQQMLQGDMPSFIINAGGNVRAGHPPMDGRKSWGVAIQDPDGFVLSDANSDILETLFVSDMSVVTSGDYQRYFVYEGRRYHHIISPDTLMPPQFFRSVTAVTEDSAWADMLSTALFLMDQPEGQRFVEQLKGVEALWIMNDRSVVMTEGLRPYAYSQGGTNRP